MSMTVNNGSIIANSTIATPCWPRYETAGRVFPDWLWTGFIAHQSLTLKGYLKVAEHREGDQLIRHCHLDSRVLDSTDRFSRGRYRGVRNVRCVKERLN